MDYSDADRALIDALYADLVHAANAAAGQSKEVTLRQYVVNLQAEALARLINAYDRALCPVATTPPKEDSDSGLRYSLILTDCGDKKIQVIKEVRAMVPGLGLKEAKDLVDRASGSHYNMRTRQSVRQTGVDVMVLENITEAEAQKGMYALEMAGATAHFERTSATPEEIRVAQERLVKTYTELSDDGGQAA